MFKFILLLLVLVNISYAQRYFIKLGSFKQFSVLEKTINRMPQDLRSHITIVKSNGWFISFAYNTTKKHLLKKKLPAYRRYFHDAYIHTSQRIINAPVVRSFVVQKSIVQKSHSRVKRIPQYQEVRSYPMAKTYPVETYSTTKTYNMLSNRTLSKSTKIPKPTVTRVDGKMQKFNKRMISGKRYYLAYKSTSDTPNLLVKVSFGNHSVVYQPMMGNMSMRDAKYLVENGKLYMFADSFSENGAFSKIDGHKKDYILVSSWTNGKKLNTLRYYYKLNDAKRYLGVKGSTDSLANALQDSEIQGVYLPNY